MPSNVKRVAVIGAGPAAAIAVEALVKEKAFDVIRVFERRERSGGCWIGFDGTPPPVSCLADLAARTADKPLDVPDQLPAFAPKSDQPRFAESSIYPYLETNVHAWAMEFSREQILEERSALSVARHGPNTPFRHWALLRQYVETILEPNENLVRYNTTVERAQRVGEVWGLKLRRDGEEEDYWWQEEFDAVVVASGRYSVPFIPSIEGLEQFEESQPGSVVHSKHFRGRDRYRGKRVVVVGASVSAGDIAFDLVETAKDPIDAVVLGHTPNVYFGDEMFNNPGIRKRPTISHISGRTVHFKDGSSVADVDNIIFGTGYSWTLPYLPDVPIRNNRVPDLYQHVVWQHDPTLLFIGAVGAGLTFKIFEWQAVYAARLLAGRATLPEKEEMQQWEAQRIEEKGDGPGFAFIHPDFEDYFETLRKMAGPGDPHTGRTLPEFEQEWFECFMEGHELRKEMWRRLIEEARGRLDVKAETTAKTEAAAARL